jgi:hypothetical protein
MMRTHTIPPIDIENPLVIDLVILGVAIRDLSVFESLISLSRMQKSCSFAMLRNGNATSLGKSSQ